jgi:polar amino acid transport system substrate-binding protein
VEKIAQSHIYLYKLKKRQDITTTSLQQIKEKYKIGVYRDDATTQYLLSKGFAIGKHLDLAIDDRQGISKLLLGRVDFIALTDISLAYRIKKLKKEKKYRQLFRRAEIEKHMFLAYTGDLYFAFSKETPDSVVARFRHSLRRIKKSDCYRRIYNNYFTLHKKKE